MKYKLTLSPWVPWSQIQLENIFHFYSYFIIFIQGYKKLIGWFKWGNCHIYYEVCMYVLWSNTDYEFSLLPIYLAKVARSYLMSMNTQTLSKPTEGKVAHDLKGPLC